MELNRISTEDGSIKDVLTVSDEVFAIDYNEALVHQIVIAYQASGRAGTKAQKSRSAVKGGGAKPWRQKGTGRARAGTSRSPIWRKGGVTFAASPRSYEQKINKKMYRKGMRMILSQLIREDRLMAIEDIHIEKPKTKLLANLIKKAKITNGIVVFNSVNDRIYLAARNIPNIKILNTNEINPINLIKAKKIFLSEDSIKKLEETLT